ncbi:hypothetical protein ABBQ32_010588 [Trebouxia sp. C0010 RCD-2024]
MQSTCQSHTSLASNRQLPYCGLTGCAVFASAAGRIHRYRLPNRCAAPLFAQRTHVHGAAVPRQTCCSAESEGGPQKSTEFGYSRKDVILIGAGIFGGGIAMYYGLQAGGVSAGMAGNFVQLFVVLGLCVGWIGSYIFRVANKDMTYVKQLENYEEEVMAKRLEEMPDSEREKLMASVEAEKERRRKQQQLK